MARARVKYTGGPVIKAMERELEKRLKHVGELVASKVRRNISTSSRANGPSAPGSMPHADSGFLRKSISHRIIDDGGQKAALIGSTVDYSRFLEEGTIHMAARPFLVRTTRELMPDIERILTAPMRHID